MAEGMAAFPFAFEKENLGQTPTKIDANGKTPGSILKRERAVLGDLAPVSRHTSTKRQKKGSRLANRRVSFAPDDQLKTMHLYTKDDERQATPEKGHVGVQETEVQAQVSPEQDLTDGMGTAPLPTFGLDSWNQEMQALSPLDSFASPSAVSMELTDISQENDYAQNDDLSHNLTGESADRTGGGITEGVPGLAELVEADAAEDEYLNRLHRGMGHAPALTPLTEETEADLRSSSYVRGASTTGLQSTLDQGERDCMSSSFEPRADETEDMSLNSMSAAAAAEDGGITVHSTGAFSSLGYTNVLEGGVHPAWGVAANETELLGPAAGGAFDSPAGAAAAAARPSGAAVPGGQQVNKWGFMPGDEDTTDLDLERNGLAVMGDLTYRHVFGGNDTTGEVTNRLTAADTTDDSLFGPLQSCAVQETDNAHETQSLKEAMAASEQGQVEEMEAPGDALPVFEDAPLSPLQAKFPVEPVEGRQEEESSESLAAHAGVGSTMRRRRSSIADLTGRLLIDDLDDDSVPLAAAPPNSPLDGSAGAKGTGKDMTTGLLLEDPSPPADGAEDGPLGELRRRLTLLQGPQKPMETGGFGRQDSSGPHTLSLLHASTTQLLATRSHLPPIAAHIPAPAAAATLADLTAASAAAEWTPAAEAGDDISADAGAELEMTPPPHTPAGQPQVDKQAVADRQVTQGGNSPDLLADQSLDDLEVPPELPSQWAPAIGAVAETPLRGLLPGGPLLARTPPPSFHGGQGSAMKFRVRPTPMRALPSPSPSPLAASHVSYPMLEVDTRELERIPGGPKLARTPIGLMRDQAPSPRQLPASPLLHDATMSPMQQVSGQASPQSSRRTPHGSVASGGPRPGGRQLAHGGRTPQSVAPAAAAQLTFQDFLKEVDLQFLDHMRRGTSINFADLASDPPPANLQAAYKLLFLTAPAVGEMEESIRTLRETIASAKDTIAEKEALIGKHNPRLFQTLQTSESAEVEAIKAGVAVLKRVCRQRTTVAWKDWRHSVEEQKRTTLQEHHARLKEDLAFLTDALQQARQLRQAAAAAAAEAASAAQARTAAHRAEAERRQRLSAMQDSLQALQTANRERGVRKAASEERLASLHAELSVLREQRAALEAAVSADAAAQAAQSADDLSEASAEAFLTKVEEMDILSGCVGWHLEGVRGAAGNASTGGGLSLRVGPLFRLRLLLPAPGHQTAQGRLELTGPEEAPLVPHSQRQVAQALCCAAFPAAADANGPLASLNLDNCTGPKLAARLLQLRTQAARVWDAVAEAAALRLEFPRLANVTAGPDGALCLGFLNLVAETKFSATLCLGPALFEGEVACDARVHFPGPARLTEAEVRGAVASAPAGYGRLRAICAALCALADAREPAPAAADAAAAGANGCTGEAAAADETAPLHVFSNPLYSVNTPKRVC